MTEAEKFVELKDRHEVVKRNMAVLQERHNQHKERAKELVASIVEKGYDHTKLPEIIAEKRAAITKALADFEAGIKAAEEAVALAEGSL